MYVFPLIDTRGNEYMDLLVHYYNTYDDYDMRGYDIKTIKWRYRGKYTTEKNRWKKELSLKFY